MQHSEITNLFDSLRRRKISKSDLYKRLLSISINTGKTYLTFLKEDLELYIRGEWKKIVDSLKIKQIQIGITKEENDIVEMPNSSLIGVSKSFKPIYFDEIEALMHPNEFVSLYTLLEIIKSEIANYNANDKQIYNELIREKNEEKYKNTLWFKVGIPIATGEMSLLLKKFNNSYLKIAIHLGNKSFEKYILSTISYYEVSNTDKNIYLHKDKMDKIIKHCKENNLPITDDFINRVPLE